MFWKDRPCGQCDLLRQEIEDLKIKADSAKADYYNCGFHLQFIKQKHNQIEEELLQLRRVIQAQEIELKYFRIKK